MLPLLPPPTFKKHMELTKLYYYFDTYVGTGSADDPWRPSLSDAYAGVQAIDLRPDPSVSGHCLVASSQPVSSSGSVLLTDDLDSNVTDQGVQIASSWGITFNTSMTWRQAISILLDGNSVIVNGKTLPGLIGNTISLGGVQSL